jgi:hypothetical protein
MSITITGGISFSGGVDIVAPPPSVATAGWFGGGVQNSPTPLSSVQRITFATDTGTPSVRGSLSSVRYNLSGTGNLTYGWFGGGSPNGVILLSTVQRITFATDTATATQRGPLSLVTQLLAAVSGVQ